MQKDKVVVFTINYNHSKMTLECVKSILDSTYNNFELIVVDNGSSKEDYEELKNNIDANVHIERIESNCGYVGGINAGFLAGSKLNPDYFLIMNNDTIIDKDAIHYLVATASTYQKNAIVSGKVYHFDNPNIIQYTGSYFSDKRYLKEVYPGKDQEDRGQCDLEEERDMLDDIFWLVPNALYERIGHYSENFFLYAEQADFALRAKKNGYKLIYTPKAIIWHKGMMTTGAGNQFSPPANFWRYKSSVVYLYRNIKRKYFYNFYTKTFIKLIAKNILNFLKLKDSSNKKTEYAALIGHLHGLKWILKQKPDKGYNPFL